MTQTKIEIFIDEVLLIIDQEISIDNNIREINQLPFQGRLTEYIMSKEDYRVMRDYFQFIKNNPKILFESIKFHLGYNNWVGKSIGHEGLRNLLSQIP